MRQNFNRYTYCLNNPLKYNDPSGFIVSITPELASEQANIAAAQRSADNLENAWVQSLPMGGFGGQGGGSGGSLIWNDGVSEQTGSTGVGADQTSNGGSSGTGETTTIGPIEGPVEYAPAVAGTYTVTPMGPFSQDNPTVSDYTTVSDVYVYADKSTDQSNPMFTGYQGVSFESNTGSGFLATTVNFLNSLDRIFAGHSMARQLGGNNLLSGSYGGRAIGSMGGAKYTSNNIILTPWDMLSMDLMSGGLPGSGAWGPLEDAYSVDGTYVDAADAFGIPQTIQPFSPWKTMLGTGDTEMIMGNGDSIFPANGGPHYFEPHH
jgi:hypothetical protein